MLDVHAVACGLLASMFFAGAQKRGRLRVRWFCGLERGAQNGLCMVSNRVVYESKSLRMWGSHAKRYVKKIVSIW